MAIIKDIAFVGYPVKNMAESRKFYEGLLELVPDPEMNNDSWVEYPIGTGTLTLGQMEGWNPSNEGAQVALEVENIDLLVKKLKENNVKIQLEIQMFPNCMMAMVNDPDGSVIILHQKKNE